GDVPGTMGAGRDAPGGPPPPGGWGPVVETYAGVPEIEAEWLARHLGDVEVVDVRSRSEFDAELGHVKGSILVPLDELRSRMDEISSCRPVVLVCPTGKRSAMGAAIPRKAGLSRVANLAGGIVRWRELGFPS